MIRFFLTQTNKGKHLVARDPRGKILSRKKYNPKTERKDVQLFLKNNSFDPQEERQRLVNVEERTVEVSSRKTRTITRTRIYQFHVTAVTRNGGKIQARSSKHEAGYPIEQAREEAYENMYYLISDHFKQGYDADKGFELAQTKIRGYQEKIIYYKKI